MDMKLELTVNEKAKLQEAAELMLEIARRIGLKGHVSVSAEPNDYGLSPYWFVFKQGFDSCNGADTLDKAVMNFAGFDPLLKKRQRAEELRGELALLDAEIDAGRPRETEGAT
jgi:hypothetical protein